mgnify:CR=1 FL=1
MPSEGLNYSLMVEDALRGVVRTALQQTGINGLSGNHHFFISFRTAAPGVEIPPYLQNTYPEEMTIVLQHQFWDLTVDEAGFAVTLSFNRIPERMKIPFAAVTSFADPSVDFGLQFRGTMTAAVAGKPLSARAHPVPPEEQPEPPLPEPAEAVGETIEDADRKSGEVVPLDAFRKKH